ncbi:MAG: NAD(P)-dependent oxidoreductase [Nanoarchaeota archaeon]
MKIGFIGLGLMGNPMAKNILKSKFYLSVYNRTSSKTTELKKLGAIVCKTPKEIADNSDVIITMVTGPDDVKKILFGKNSASKSKNKPIVIDMSTIGPKAAKEIALKLKKQKIEFIDAPVTGSTPAAISGTLTIFVGGNKNIFDKIKPVLEAMGKNIHYTGKTGSGQAIKLVNNMIVAIEMVAVAEAMLLADEQKISRKMAFEALENAPIMSNYMRMKMNNIVNNDFSTLFSARNMEKDLKLAIKETKKKLPFLEKTKKLFSKTIEKGLGEKDLSIIIKHPEKN